jgi:acetyl esterase/lipase
MCDFSPYGGASDEWLHVQATLPVASEEQDLGELKKANNHGREATACKEMTDFASRISTHDHILQTRDGDSVEARGYRPAGVSHTNTLPIYMHFHGGGLLFGTLSSEDAICARIAAGAQVMVFNVNYRHSPQYIYPTAWDDAEDAFDWVLGNSAGIGGDSHRIVVGGISGGAQPSAALVLRR